MVLDLWKPLSSAEDDDGAVARGLFPERSPLGAEAAGASPPSLPPATPLPLSSPAAIYTPTDRPPTRGHAASAASGEAVRGEPPDPRLLSSV